MSLKSGTLALQFLANLAEVINLAVVDNPVSTLRVLHRLMTEGREVENRETPMAQADFYRLRDFIANGDAATVIGTPVGKRLGSALQKIWIHTRIFCEDTENTAHRVCSLYMQSRVDINCLNQDTQTEVWNDRTVLGDIGSLHLR